MSRPSFDVLTQSWIPVIRSNGTRDELGILDCLDQAHDLREIRDPSPIVEFGLYRLLVAFVLDALVLANRRPEDPLDLQSFIEEQRFDSNMIKDYIKQCGDVFDLFHSEKPFLQTKMQGGLKPLAGMFPAAPSGTNVSHWHHESEDSFEVGAPEAVRLLATISPFMTAGGAGLSPSINGAPAVYALPLGANLFETIVLNMPLRHDQDMKAEMIAWRNERVPGQERSRASIVEALTWRPRKIQLVPTVNENRSVRVREMKFEKGDSARLPWIDPNLAYRYDKDKVTPIRMRENRPLWRDAGPLLFLREIEHGRGAAKVSFRRPDVVEQMFQLKDDHNTLVVQFYGMRTDMKMKIFEWAKSAWSVPSRLGRSTRLGSLVHYELDRSEKAAYKLRKRIKALYPREGAGNKEALGCVADRCERAYWHRLEAHFHPLMDDFSKLDPNAPDDSGMIAMTAKNWRDAIRHLACEQFEFAAKDMDADSDALERQVRARTWLNNELRKILA